MANVCYNWIEVVGDAGSISELRDYLEDQEDYYLEFNESTDPTLLVFSLESRWVAPVEFLKIISREYNLLVECESEECSCDYYFKCGYRNGEKIFEINLGYLEGKYHSLDWNDFIEREVMWRLDNDESIDEFIEQFEDFCTYDEIAELKEIFVEHLNLN